MSHRKQNTEGMCKPIGDISDKVTALSNGVRERILHTRGRCGTVHVFVKRGAVFAIDVESMTAQTMLRDPNASLLGTYTRRAKPRDIADDFKTYVNELQEARAA